MEEKNKCLNSSVYFCDKSLVHCNQTRKGLQIKVPVLSSFETFKLILSHFLTFKHGNVIPNSVFRFRVSYITLFHAVHPLTPPVTSSLPFPLRHPPPHAIISSSLTSREVI